MEQVRTIGRRLAQNWRRVLGGIGLALLAVYILRGCIPGLQGRGGMPSSVYNRIERQYVNCIDDYFVIHPGEHRQPDCGSVIIDVRARGVVPADQQAAGVTRALCYQVTTTNPYVDVNGLGAGHEEFWKTRTSSKVTVLQNGQWQLFPDKDTEDEARWMQFACPGQYE